MPFSSWENKQILLGVGGNDNHPIYYRPEQFKILPVVGGNKSGKTTLLKTIALNALAQGYHCIIIAPKKSALTALVDMFENITRLPKEARLTQQELEPLIIDHPENLILIDDSQLLSNIPAGEWLRSFIQMGDHENCGNIVAATNIIQGVLGFNTWTQEMKNIGAGIALQPTDTSLAEFIQTAYSRSYFSTMDIPGRALFNTGDGLLTLQVAESDSFINEYIKKSK